MKTKSYLCAAFIAALAMSPAAYAAHNSGHFSGPPPRGITPAASDNESAMMKAARYPLRLGTTVLRTPQMLGETFVGKRAFISERGLFQTVDESPAAPKTHTPQDRSPRSSR